MTKINKDNTMLFFIFHDFNLLEHINSYESIRYNACGNWRKIRKMEIK